MGGGSGSSAGARAIWLRRILPCFVCRLREREIGFHERGVGRIGIRHRGKPNVPPDEPARALLLAAGSRPPEICDSQQGQGHPRLFRPRRDRRRRPATFAAHSWNRCCAAAGGMARVLFEAGPIAIPVGRAGVESLLMSLCAVFGRRSAPEPCSTVVPRSPGGSLSPEYAAAQVIIRQSVTVGRLHRPGCERSVVQRLKGYSVLTPTLRFRACLSVVRAPFRRTGLSSATD